MFCVVPHSLCFFQSQLHAGKAMTLWKKTTGASILMFLFAVSFASCRIAVFSCVVTSVFSDVPAVSMLGEVEHVGFIILLFLLLSMQVFWFSMILKR
jgi:hypothetical protein